MESQTQIIIAVLLAANTSILGIAASLLLKRLDSLDVNATRAHKRIDDHIGDHDIHTVSK